MTTSHQPYALCVVIPCYNNARTIRAVAHAVREEIPEVIIVDDGSDAATKAELAALAQEGFGVVTRPANGGKGAAVKSGFAAASARGFTHALQVDADGQHDLAHVPAFVELSRERPDALLLAHPVFDESAPLGRRIGRTITQFWTHIETLGRHIVDPMCGFRLYPLAPAIAADARGDHMEFDIEIAVKMVRLGTPVINLPVGVRYLSEEEGGLSSFRMWRDNVAISLAHTRLVLSMLPWLWRRRRRPMLNE